MSVFVLFCWLIGLVDSLAGVGPMLKLLFIVNPLLRRLLFLFLMTLRLHLSVALASLRSRAVVCECVVCRERRTRWCQRDSVCMRSALNIRFRVFSANFKL